MSYRVYGPKTGNSSWPRVARGIFEGLSGVGVKVDFYDTNAILEDSDALSEGWEADVGIYVGPPAGAAVLASRGRHEHRLVMVAANSSWLPDGSMRAMAKVATGFLAPSHWAMDVLLRYSGELPVFLYKHGVSLEFKPDPEYIKLVGRNNFSVAHFASTSMQRKGTCEIIEAWAHLKTLASTVYDDRAILDLYIEGSHEYARKAISEAVQKYDGFKSSSVCVGEPANLSEGDMRLLYQNYHVICQPSRSEGFGMVPLEALCSGVPIVATSGTGHLEYLRQGTPGAKNISMLADGPIDDGPDAVAPMVDYYSIVNALAKAKMEWRGLAEQAALHASDLGQRWSWQAVSEEFVERFENWTATYVS